MRVAWIPSRLQRSLSRCQRSYSPVGMLRLSATGWRLGAVQRSPHREHWQSVAPDSQPVVVAVGNCQATQLIQARAEEPPLSIRAPRFPGAVANARCHELPRQCHGGAVARLSAVATTTHNGLGNVHTIGALEQVEHRRRGRITHVDSPSLQCA